MPLDDDASNTIATRMLADYDAVTPGMLYADGLRLDLPDAWRVQTAVTRLREARGERVVGYKVGCVDPGNQALMGVPHPVWGRLWNSEQYGDAASLAKSDFANISIEAEFGVTLARDITPGMSIDELVGCIDAIHPLLELHNLVMRGDAPHGHELVSNNCINCGVVRGAPVTELADSRQTDLKLIYDGKIVDEWATLSWPGDILAAVDWLAGNLSEHGLSMKAGDLILTGAWGPPIPVEGHTLVEVTSSAFGSVSATFNYFPDGGTREAG
jgi:2-keto-4-pentenoate hydratase